MYKFINFFRKNQNLKGLNIHIFHSSLSVSIELKHSTLLFCGLTNYYYLCRDEKVRLWQHNH